MRVLSLSVRPKLRSPFFHQPELNSFPSEYIGSTAVGRGSSAACSLGQRSFLGFLFVRPPPPMFLVSVAFKGLRYCASSLFATHRRELRSGVSKGLRLHKNCARGTVGRAVDPEGDRPPCSRKECPNPLIPKCFPNALGQRNAQERASR